MLVAEVIDNQLKGLSGDEIINILNDYRHPMFETVYEVIVAENKMFSEDMPYESQ
jgi:hypothetical protein